MGFFGAAAATASVVQTPMRNAELVREIKLAGCPPARARFAPPPVRGLTAQRHRVRAESQDRLEYGPGARRPETRGPLDAFTAAATGVRPAHAIPAGRETRRRQQRLWRGCGVTTSLKTGCQKPACRDRRLMTLMTDSDSSAAALGGQLTTPKQPFNF